MKFLLPILLLLANTALAKEVLQLNEANTVIIRGEINAQSMITAQMQLAKQAIKRGTKNYPLYLVLDSGGGSVAAGNMFITFARLVPNLNTVTIFSASMASAIVEQLPGKRYILDGGLIMFHRAYAGMEGQVETGELESRLEMVKKEIRRMEQKNADRMLITLEQYKAKIVNELWLNSDDAVSQNAIDTIVDIQCASTMITSVDKMYFMTLFGPVGVTFSKCPLFRAPVEVSDARFKYKVPNFGK